jgi:transposase
MWVPPEVKEPVLMHSPTRKSIGHFGSVRLPDGKFVYQREDEVFNKEKLWSFLKTLRKKSSHSKKRVMVILDNARYHHANLHKEWRNVCDEKFHCEYLPPYSPELNPAERIWKLTSRLCIHDTYFPTISDVDNLFEPQFDMWERSNEELRKLCKI